MGAERLTAAECEEIEAAMRDDAAFLPPGSIAREKLLQLAEAYRVLAGLKRIVRRQVN